MKHYGTKKQPTRRDYSLALKTIRAQFHTIESQADTIRRQNQFMVTIWIDGRSPRGRKSEEEIEQESPSGWIN